MRIFLVLPLREEFNDISLAIRQVVETLGHTLVKIDELFTTGGVSEQVQDEIRKASLIIGDISTLNPNVMFELGFAQSSDIPILALCQRGEFIPFDVSSVRIIIYDRERLNDTLSKPLRNFLAHSNFDEYV